MIYILYKNIFLYIGHDKYSFKDMHCRCGRETKEKAISGRGEKVIKCLSMRQNIRLAFPAGDRSEKGQDSGWMQTLLCCCYW